VLAGATLAATAAPGMYHRLLDTISARGEHPEWLHTIRKDLARTLSTNILFSATWDPTKDAHWKEHWRDGLELPGDAQSVGESKDAIDARCHCDDVGALRKDDSTMGGVCDVPVGGSSLDSGDHKVGALGGGDISSIHDLPGPPLPRTRKSGNVAEGEETAATNQKEAVHDMPSRVPSDGLAALGRVLVATAALDPDGVGYCQGMSNLAAILLIAEVPEEDAFLVLATMLSSNLKAGAVPRAAALVPGRPSYQLRELYRPGVPLCLDLCDCLRICLQKHLPKLAAHLLSVGFIDVCTLCGPPWFMTLFTNGIGSRDNQGGRERTRSGGLPMATVFLICDILLSGPGKGSGLAWDTALHARQTLLCAALAILDGHKRALMSCSFEDFPAVLSGFSAEETARPAPFAKAIRRWMGRVNERRMRKLLKQAERGRGVSVKE
jgi:hypothetical protein